MTTFAEYHFMHTFFVHHDQDQLDALRGKITEFQYRTRDLVEQMKKEGLNMPHFSKFETNLYSEFFLSEHPDQKYEPNIVFNAWDREKDLYVIGKVTYSGVVSILVLKVVSWERIAYAAAYDSQADAGKVDDFLKGKACFSLGVQDDWTFRPKSQFNFHPGSKKHILDTTLQSLKEALS